ncbi:MAG: N-acetylmuramoyl-L-alanine amidase [Rhodobacter sp.]|nr:N-acetylmuramoyl-L-alanine amidase [Rhodobacter sp.]MCY4168104.1 N-acetylmuramoyl-L-alanine amidase [Rhodobacter sp.]MCY4242457.1 N-acetylmuramoyl-L-alanine amidase [Rhodobacter sp.]
MIQHPSPNFGHRRGGALPDIVVLHGTAMDSAAAALERLCSPDFEVSAHYLIAIDGETFCLVNEDLRAWHAGAGSWGGVTDVNSRSIGIELDNVDGSPFPEPQMAALETLLAGIMKRWSISPARVIAHSDMAPARKRDPGPKFDWRRLALADLSIWPEEMTHSLTALPERRAGTGSPDAAFRAAAMEFGYPDVATETLLAAFRRRFLPHMDGSVTADDLTAIRNLVRRFPVDRS